MKDCTALAILQSIPPELRARLLAFLLACYLLGLEPRGRQGKLKAVAMAASNSDTKSRRLIVVLAGMLLASGARTATAAASPEDCSNMLNAALNVNGVEVMTLQNACQGALLAGNDFSRLTVPVQDQLNAEGCCGP